MRYFSNLRLETFTRREMPNIQFHEMDVGQINMCFVRAQPFFMSPTLLKWLNHEKLYSFDRFLCPPPLLKWLNHGKLYSFDQQLRHLWAVVRNFMPNIGLKVAAAKLDYRRAHKQHLC